MSDSTTTAPRCPTCGNEGPTHGRSYCDVCGELNDWGELARRGPAAPGGGNPPSGPSAPAGDAGDQQQRRARELLVPLDENEPPPAPVLPGRPSPVQYQNAPQAADESGVVCWNCHVGNRTDRRFCRNCGADLRAAPRPAPAPMPSGGGSGGFGAWLRRRWILVVTGVVVVAAIVLGILFLPALFTDDDVSPPLDVSASNSDPQHPPASAVDDKSDSWWGTGHKGDNSDNDALVMTFKQPFDLQAVRILPGTSDRDEDKDKQNRPEKIRIDVEDTSGQTKTFDVRLRDGGRQEFATPVDGATKVTLTVLSAYVTNQNGEVAIADVKFRGSTSADNGNGDNRNGDNGNGNGGN